MLLLKMTTKEGMNLLQLVQFIEPTQVVCTGTALLVSKILQFNTQVLLSSSAYQMNRVCVHRLVK